MQDCTKANESPKRLFPRTFTLNAASSGAGIAPVMSVIDRSWQPQLSVSWKRILVLVLVAVVCWHCWRQLLSVHIDNGASGRVVDLVPVPINRGWPATKRQRSAFARTLPPEGSPFPLACDLMHFRETGLTGDETGRPGTPGKRAWLWDMRLQERVIAKGAPTLIRPRDLAGLVPGAISRTAAKSCLSQSLKHSGSGSLMVKDVVIGVWVCDKTSQARWDSIFKSWFVGGSVVFLSSDIEGAHVIPTHASDSYSGTTMKGHIGLIKMMAEFPDKKWYGIVGEDNFVHWPSLLAGLAEITATELELHDNTLLAVSETAYGIHQMKRGNRFFGGGGIFLNRPCGLLLRPSLLRKRRVCSQCGQGLCPEECSVTHDVDITSLLVKHDVRLVHADFLDSQPPCFYVASLQSGCGPGSWRRTPPAVFHYLTTTEVVFLADLAAFAAAVKKPSLQLGSRPQPFEIPLPLMTLSGNLCSHPSASCARTNCQPSFECTVQLLVASWSSLENRASIPTVNASNIGSSRTRVNNLVTLKHGAELAPKNTPTAVPHITRQVPEPVQPLQWPTNPAQAAQARRKAQYEAHHQNILSIH